MPAVLAARVPDSPCPTGTRSTGRRLALARWLTAPDHPLTARVQVNRIVGPSLRPGARPDDGELRPLGERPSHPELLDWLATEFVRIGLEHEGHAPADGHSRRRIGNRRQADARKQAVDPENVLLGSWRPRRIEGEVLRDSILAVSGKLNPAPFGPPVPVSPATTARSRPPTMPKDNSRSIYLMVRRSQHLTLLDLFDTP